MRRLLSRKRATRLCHNLLRRIIRSSSWFYKLLWSFLIVDKLPLAKMLRGVRSPDLIGKVASLTFSVLVRTARIKAGIEFAGNLKVCELAAFSSTVGAVAA
jgi:hypothetical protein